MRPSASQVSLFVAIILILAVSTFSFAAPSITSLNPTSGAVGTSVTITGSGFGSTQGSSTVKFNTTTATSITSWSATTIVAIVPSGATTGNVVVRVSGVNSNGKSFTVVAAPSVSSLSPTSGGVGQSITVNGSGFGSTQGSSTIKFNGTLATPTSWTSTQIKAPVPAGATSGNVVVHASGVDSNGKPFTVLPTPTIANIDPTSGYEGDSITITGANFGTTQGTSTVKFNGTTATPTSWSDTSIVTPVPTGATTGSVVVTVSGVASAGVNFTVIAVPNITSLSPTSGAVGALVTINGTNFQPTQGDSTVSFNGTLATPTSWTATQIKAPVPPGATSGNVLVNAFGMDSNTLGFTVKPTPVITSLSQTIGSPGMTITVNGANFGSSQGSSTVKFNGTTATVSTWSTNKITVTVPSAATTGNVIVHTSGVDTNGINFVVSTVTSISVSPQNLSVPVNSVQRFVANATYANGNTQALVGNASWSSTNTVVATVDTSGIATAGAQGQTTIQATVGSFSGSTMLTVKEPSFTPVGDLNVQRWGHTATLLPDGRVLVVGGGDTWGTLSSAELYDPITRSFSWTGSLRTARTNHSATLLPNGKVLIAGGSRYVDGVGSVGVWTMELYDPATGSFSEVPGNVRNAYHSETQLATGKILFVGVQEPQQVYDPAAGTLSDAGNSVLPRYYHTASGLNDGTVLVAGGSDGMTFDDPYTGAELYDPATGTFSATGSLGTASMVHTATVLNDGKVLIAGGTSTAFSWTYLNRAELYDPAVGVFTSAGSLAVPRAGQTATLLSDGSTLIIGGQVAASPYVTPYVELYDGSTRSFVGAGSLVTARSSHTATMLSDGTVLVAGGSGESGILTRAELYAPPLPPPTFLQITPDRSNMLVGQTQQFKVVDQLGRQRYDVSWSVSDSNIAPITPGGSPILTAAAAGQVILSANVQGIVAQMFITITPSSLMVTPSTVSMEVGGSRQFRVIDNLGHMSGNVVWTLSDPNLATITVDDETTLTATAAGNLTLTATVEGVAAQAQIAISPLGSLGPGSILWGVSATPGFVPVQLAQAVPSENGPDFYSVEVSADGAQSVVQALTADGRQKWQANLPVTSNNSVPDGFGGLIVTLNNTCNPGQTDPMTIVDLGANGVPQWQIEAAGVWDGQKMVYCYPSTSPPQIAIRPDGAPVISEPTNAGLLPFTVGNQSIYIPPSSWTDPSGVVHYNDYSLLGSPIVDTDGSTYVEYQVRDLAYPPRVTSSIIYLLKVAMDGSQTTTQLMSNAELNSSQYPEPTNSSLLPGRILPDGQGGVIATWTISPSNPPSPPQPWHYYQAAHVVSDSVVARYDLPFLPNKPVLNRYPTLVLGENGTAFVTDGADPDNGPQIMSFNLSSGAANWSYQATVGDSLTLIVSTAGNGLVAKKTDATGNDTLLTFSSSGGTQSQARRSSKIYMQADQQPATSKIDYYTDGRYLGFQVGAKIAFKLTTLEEAVTPGRRGQGDAAHNGTTDPGFRVVGVRDCANKYDDSGTARYDRLPIYELWDNSGSKPAQHYTLFEYVTSMTGKITDATRCGNGTNTGMTPCDYADGTIIPWNTFEDNLRIGPMEGESYSLQYFRYGLPGQRYWDAQIYRTTPDGNSVEFVPHVSLTLHMNQGAEPLIQEQLAPYMGPWFSPRPSYAACNTPDPIQ